MKSNFDITRLNDIPESAGVYLWKDKTGLIMYVGKAKKLKTRMMQYFKGSVNSYKTSTMVEKIADFECVFTKDEKEALLVEQTYIKKYRPSYNILMMDAKKYPYIKVELTSKKLIIKKVYEVAKNTKSCVYYGPFVPSTGINALLNSLQSTAFYERGILVDHYTYDDWKIKFELIVDALEHIPQYIKYLENKINLYNEESNYEASQELWKTVGPLRYYNDKQIVEITKYESIDVFAFKAIENTLYVSVFFYRNGLQISRLFEQATFDLTFEEAASEFLKKFYAKHLVPKFICLDTELENIDFNLTKIRTPKQGELKLIIDSCTTNLNTNIHFLLNKANKSIKILHDIEEITGIKKLRNFIILDNSHNNSKSKIGAINFYRNGIEDNKYNRYYNLDIDSTGDYYLMQESLNKYIKSGLLESLEIDVIFVDGGKAQISSIERVLKNNDCWYNIIGLVKNDKHMTDHMIYNGQKIDIKNSKTLNYLRNIQELVDSKAKYKFNKKFNTLITTESLLEIPGITQEKINKLLHTFEKYEHIKEAQYWQLELVLGAKDGKSVFDYFSTI